MSPAAAPTWARGARVATTPCCFPNVRTRLQVRPPGEYISIAAAGPRTNGQKPAVERSASDEGYGLGSRRFRVDDEEEATWHAHLPQGCALLPALTGRKAPLLSGPSVRLRRNGRKRRSMHAIARSEGLADVRRASVPLYSNGVCVSRYDLLVLSRKEHAK